MSGDIMDFEDDWREFLRVYSFTDSEEVYTNGSDLISAFRVEQMVGHYFEQTCYSERDDCWECSECGFLDAYATGEGYNYCPNCGRKVMA